MSQIIDPVALMPRQYRSDVKRFYGSDVNTIVLRVDDPNSGKEKPVRFAFTFKGDTLLKPKQLVRRLGSEAALQAQELAWKLLPKDSRGNFLVYPNGLSIKGDNCLVYKSPGTKTNNDNSVFFQSTNCESNKSPGSVFYRSSFSAALNSPSTIFRDSSSCISNDGSSNKFEGCQNSYTNASKSIRQKSSTNTRFEKCVEVVVDGCNDIKAYGCSVLKLLATSGKELKELTKRQISNGELKLCWYEQIPFLGKLFIPQV